MDGNNLVANIKAFFGAIGAVWSFIVGAMGWAFPTLVVLMLADFVSGMMAGSTREGLNSGRGRKGFVKKAHILILIGLVYLIEGAAFGTRHAGDGVTFAYIAIEFISLTENAGKLGVPLGPLAKFIEILKPKGEVK